MNPIALGLVLTSAFCHASWNYLAKRSRVKPVFLWWCHLVGVFLYLPMFIYWSNRVSIPLAGWICIVATSMLHAFYFGFLGAAYEEGNLSLVYPLARGLGVLLVPVLAVTFIQEELSFLGILGIGQILGGIYLLHLPRRSTRAWILPLSALRGPASRWAFTTGGTIALYSMVDKVGVKQVNPPTYIYLMIVGTWFFLTPYVIWRSKSSLRPEWEENRKPIFANGFLIFFTYLLVLFAMQMSKVSYVAALRESSILISVLYGVAKLKEESSVQRVLGAILIFFGVLSIALSR